MMKKQQQPAAAFKELVDRKCTKWNGYVVALFLQGRRTFFPFIPPPLFSFRPSRAGVCVCVDVWVSWLADWLVGDTP